MDWMFLSTRAFGSVSQVLLVFGTPKSKQLWIAVIFFGHFITQPNCLERGRAPFWSLCPRLLSMKIRPCACICTFQQWWFRKLTFFTIHWIVSIHWLSGAYISINFKKWILLILIIPFNILVLNDLNYWTTVFHLNLYFITFAYHICSMQKSLL